MSYQIHMGFPAIFWVTLLGWIYKWPFQRFVCISDLQIFGGWKGLPTDLEPPGALVIKARSVFDTMTCDAAKAWSFLGGCE